jgi:hypothetical protein
MRQAGAERGQGTIEYLAVVALVGFVLALAAVAGAPGIANAVLRGFQHGLCLVLGGDCLATEHRPCVVRADARDETVAVHVALVRIGQHAGVLREDLSDGTVRVTEIDDLGVGGAIGLGAHGRVAIAGMDAGVGAGVDAAAGGWLGHTRTFNVRDRREADELIDRLKRGSHGALVLSLPRRIVGSVVAKLFGAGRRREGPAPDEVSFAGGLQGSAQGVVPGPSADWNAAVAAALGGVWERRTGRRTFFVGVAGEAEIALRRAFAAAGLRGGGDVRVGLTLDRDGRPLELGVLMTAAATAYGGTLGVPGLHLPSRQAAGRIEVEAALDLTLPENASATRRFLAQLRRFAPSSPRLARAAADVAWRLAQRGRIDVRAYSTATSSRGVEGDVALGVGAGAEVELTASTARLLAAYTRPSGGAWEQRVDCRRS